MMQNGLDKMSKFYHSKDILLLGGMGFFGSNTALALLDAGAKVTIFDAMMTQYGANPANVDGIRDRLEIIEGDIRDIDSLKKAVRGKDLIFNYAAQVSHVDSMKDPYLDIDINCRGNINVLEAVRQVNDGARIVLASTRSQVGRRFYEPVDEKHPEFPTDIYSVDKSAAEKYYLIYTQAYGLFATSLRVTNAYGPRAQVKTTTYGVVNYFIRLAIEGKTIELYAPGTQKRDCLYVDDVVAAMMLAGASQGARGEVFNVASGKTYPLLEIVKEIIRIARTGNYVLASWPDDRKRIEVGDVSISIDKIQRVLGWKPTVEISEGIQRSVDYLRPRIQQYV